MRSKLDALKKPLLAVLLTHGHPDHYNGLTTLTKGLDVPIIATKSVNDVIVKNDAAKYKQWGPVFGDEWPKKRTFPNRVVDSKYKVKFGDLTFQVFDLGPAESDADSYWKMTYKNKTYGFIGDIVKNRIHAYLADGHSKKWLAVIKRLKKDLRDATMVFPGHGGPGSLEMLDWQASYIRKYRVTVDRLLGKKTQLSNADKDRLHAEMMAFLPSTHLEFLIKLGADSVAEELKDR